MVAIYDRQVLGNIICGDLKHPPLIIGGKSFEEARCDRNVWRRHNVVGVVPNDAKIEVRNAGQAAVIWALKCGFRDLHLWAFESVWARHRISISDEKYPKKGNPNPINDWSIGWDQIHQLFPKVTFKVHVPKGQQCLWRPHVFKTVEEKE